MSHLRRFNLTVNCTAEHLIALIIKRELFTVWHSGRIYRQRFKAVLFLLRLYVVTPWWQRYSCLQLLSVRRALLPPQFINVTTNTGPFGRIKHAGAPCQHEVLLGSKQLWRFFLGKMLLQLSACFYLLFLLRFFFFPLKLCLIIDSSQGSFSSSLPTNWHWHATKRLTWLISIITLTHWVVLQIYLFLFFPPFFLYF